MSQQAVGYGRLPPLGRHQAQTTTRLSLKGEKHDLARDDTPGAVARA